MIRPTMLSIRGYTAATGYRRGDAGHWFSPSSPIPPQVATATDLWLRGFCNSNCPNRSSPMAVLSHRQFGMNKHAFSCWISVAASIVIAISLIVRHYRQNAWKAIAHGNAIRLNDILTNDPSKVDLKSKRKHRTLLHYAAQLGNFDACEVLVAHGIYVNAMDSDGASPLLWATQYGHHRICKYLISNGAAPNRESRHGETPLSVAAYNGSIEILSLLIGHGVPVNYANRDGKTALHFAAKGNRGHAMPI